MRFPQAAAWLLALSPSLSFADSAGTFALGSDYAVFTTFCSGYGASQCLHIVPYATSGELEVADTVPVQVSHSVIVLRDRQIFLRWYQKFYAFEVSYDWKLKYIHSLDLPKPGTSKYPLVVDDDYVYLYNESDVLMLDVSKPPADWVPYLAPDAPNEEAAGKRFLDNGVWSIANGTCVEHQNTDFCLVSGKSHKPYMIYEDVFLIRRGRGETISSLLHLYSDYRSWD